MSEAPIFDTVGGKVSLDQLFKRLAELVRLMREDMKALERSRGLRGDNAAQFQWHSMAQNFTAIALALNTLRHDKIKSGIGYGD